MVFKHLSALFLVEGHSKEALTLFPAPLEFGARFTNRTDKQALAALVVRQGETTASSYSDFWRSSLLKTMEEKTILESCLTQRTDGARPDLDILLK